MSRTPSSPRASSTTAAQTSCAACLDGTSRATARIVLLVIDPTKLTSELRVEESRPGDWYPHVYGPIDRIAVVSVFPIEAGSTGAFILPDGLG